MPQPTFTGSVDISIFFGTKYDDLNIPYYSSQIITQATKRLDMNRQVVWQTTWLSHIDVNIKDYQDIVGAQYVQIKDTGVENEGSHWFDVIAYQNISKKCCRITIKYNPLLSINVAHITKISGTMKRWTVRDDALFKYVKSPEPINQIDDFDYTYFRHNCIDDSSGLTVPRNIIGFPYDMTKQPEILEYKNSNGSSTNIYYPSLTAHGLNTLFYNSIGGEWMHTDDLTYYRMWNPNIVRDNYNYAIGLGYDLVSNAYAIPRTSLIEFEDGDDYIERIRGTTQKVLTNLPLTTGSYNNAKASYIGNMFTLYNEVTGDSVTVDAADLADTTLTLMANPYITGFLAARFSTYMHDNNGYSGIVKSASYSPVTLTSTMASGSSVNKLQTAMSVDSLTVSSQNANDTARFQRMANERKLGANELRSVGSFFGSLFSGDFGGAINSGVNAGVALMDYDTREQEIRTNLNNMERSRAQQMAQLSANGTLGQIAPPPIKFSNDFNVSANGFTFVVRKTSLSAFDRQRADRFFTAFGYNTDNEILNNPNQLYARQRFTFIQADDVEIEELSSGTDLTRVRDFQTITEIKNRFAAGLRIWFAEPNFDWTLPNPPRSEILPSERRAY